MIELFSYAEFLESQDDILFDKSVFNLPTNDDIFKAFINEIIVKYYIKYNNDKIFSSKENISYRKMNNPYEESFCALNNPYVIARFPKRERLIEELATINLLTRCIDLKVNKKETLESGIIPTFNELEYIKRYYPNLINEYYEFLKSNAIYAAKHIDGLNTFEDKRNLEIILANYSLEKNKIYNINTLNKINCNKKELRMQLVKKGYTI